MDQQISKAIEIETALLKAMANRDNFELYSKSINKKRLYEATGVLLEDYEKYFDLYKEHKQIDFELFYTQFSQSWHNTDFDNEDINYYRDYVIPAINKADTKEVETSLLGLIQKQTLEEINRSSEKTFDIEKISSILEEYKAKHGEIITEYDDDCYTINNVDFSVLEKKKGIPYFLPSLQAALGSLTKGQFIVVSADYGAGKSAFVLSQAAAGIRHLQNNGENRPILYFNSEGTEADVYVRLMSNLYRDKIAGGFEQVLTNISKVKEVFNKQYNPDNFKVFQLTGHNLAYIKTKMQKHNPALVIIDICDSLVPEESPALLKKLYDNIRQLSNAFCPIIGTSQSGDTSYFDKDTGEKKNRQWLGGKALYGSKTGKGGAADTILTIGKDENSDLRYVEVAKHKRGRAVRVTCEIDGLYSDYREVKWG